ncbi:PREDICTED: uncharacterized protein LOC109343867 isoform X2 [Lupinus angustifolius]|uniref:uncharacterized protein LOC109343867 isoform X2 n=1 Tax=Lupinus angustifolius TaxID=3871 RepID=UPI00092FD772|nr:PREDICTED: uncharacterized protein LOC109343867 isoform X2 [Lupinus angustifolius]
MASSFDLWGKDPFFNAAEQVQESSDRMEYAYRTWIHAKKDPLSPYNIDELRRDLHTTHSTAKLQLDEFQRAVSSSYSKSSSVDAVARHRLFISAIDGKITEIEHGLLESVPSGDKASFRWVRLDEGERYELALFLSGMSASEPKSPHKCIRSGSENIQSSDKDSFRIFSDNLRVSSGKGSSEAMEVKSPEHCRTAGADIASWKITVSVKMQNSSNISSGPMHKVSNLSGFLNSKESVSKWKWPKNGYRKLQAGNHHQETDDTLLSTTQSNAGINTCYEKSKSYKGRCDECYDKQLYGWYGSIQRQLLRSQYQMQYNWPVQLTFWMIILLCFIGKNRIFMWVSETVFLHKCMNLHALLALATASWIQL